MGKTTKFALAFVLLPVFAVSPLFSLQIDPLRMLIQVSAGQEQTGSITITNSKQTPVNVLISLQNSLLEGDIEWLSLDKDSVFLEANQKANINYRVLIPEGVVGECNARIAFLENPVASGEQSMLSIKTKISIPFFASVKGTEIQDLEILSFEVNEDKSDEAKIVIHNKGNVHVRPTGMCLVKISGEHGDQLIQSTQVNHDGYPVRPGKKQAFELKFSDPLVAGSYTAEFKLKSITQISHTIKDEIKFQLD